MNMINREEINELLADLIKIPSPYFEEEAIMEFAQKWLRERNVPVKIHRYHEKAITDFRGINLTGVIDSGKVGPTVYFNGHLDTVKLCNGWTVPPYDAVVKDGHMYGLGALDMKCGCAIIMNVLAEFKKNISEFSGKIIYHLVSDEEGPFGLGTTYLINDREIEKADIAIVTEPSAGFAGVQSPSISLGARGGYNYTIKLYGKSSHAAMPELGINALVDASKIACELEKIKMITDDKLISGSHCLINIKGGGAACSVPDYAELEVFRHIVRSENRDTIEKEVKEAIGKADISGSYKLEFRSSPAENFDGGFMPYIVDENNEYVKALKSSIRKIFKKEATTTYFTSMGDFNHIGAKLGIPTIIFGPDGNNYHSYDEHVNLESTWETAESIYDFLVNILDAK
ncbi:MAG: M20/M25/M40 family metallo-hydrolase [Proteocatella sp.]